MTELAYPPIPSAVEAALIHGDLGKLTTEQRLEYYRAVCGSLGLNPLTKPFEYIVLNNKLTLYATRAATDQLRARHAISIEIVSAEEHDGIYVVRARAKTPDGRTDEATGAVSLIDQRGERLRGDALANAWMKAETKAKRRVTLSIVGLGWLDESELETIPAEVKRPWKEPTPDPVSALPEGDAEQDVEQLRQKLTVLMRERRSDLSPDLIERARAAYRNGDANEIKTLISTIEGGK